MISLIILIINTIVYYSCFHFRNIVTARCLYYIVVAILASLINQTSNLNKLYLCAIRTHCVVLCVKPNWNIINNICTIWHGICLFGNLFVMCSLTVINDIYFVYFWPNFCSIAFPPPWKIFCTPDPISNFIAIYIHHARYTCASAHIHPSMLPSPIYDAPNYKQWQRHQGTNWRIVRSMKRTNCLNK